MTLDSYTSAEAESLLSAAEERLARERPARREALINFVGAVSFVVTASLLAALAPWAQSLSISSLALVLVTWALIERVRFPVAGGWTYPTMLVFVPALFILPTPLVPLVAMAGAILRRGPDLIRGRVSLTKVPVFVADAWFSIGPAVVIIAAGAQLFSWSHWPVYLAALCAQVLCDMAASLTWSWVGEGIQPRVQLPLLAWLYAFDVALAPLGLAIAAVSVEHPPLVLLALSPMAMLWLFARERHQRMTETVALSTAYRGTAMLLGDVVEADHHYTGAHSRDVVELSLAVADHFRLDGTGRRNVEFAALLHDVGKINIPKEIINKPGKLSEAEWELMRTHTIDGERMLTQVGGLLADVGRIVRATHEHVDGRGYPDGLRGDAIPIEARIVCACDAYSAMTTDRSYRPAMSKRDALAELQRCAGSQFDRRVVAAIAELEGADLIARNEWLELLGSSGTVGERPASDETEQQPAQPAPVAPAPAVPAPATLVSNLPLEEILKERLEAADAGGAH